MTRSRLSARDSFLVWVVGGLGPALVRLLGATWRVSVEGTGPTEEIHGSGGRVIYAFWHGQLLPLEYIYRGRGICVLSSWHRDGEMSARLMRSLGYAVVRGSTSRGSARGLVGMLTRLRDGHDLAVTPDGPRGPVRKAERGIFFLSERSGAPVVPVAVWARPAKLLLSWDRFLVPLPFARVAVVYGEPLAPEPCRDAIERAGELTEMLDRLTDAARARVGS
jgi:lysophospholipid acyltransferase (LPLAT)-like uncharacterized protein